MMRITIILLLAITFQWAITQGAAQAGVAQSPTEAATNFTQRVESYFADQSGKPFKPAKKRPPLRPDRGNFTRAYSFSVVGFAARCFFLNEQLDQANAALADNAQHYLDNPKDIVDRDSFHWHADIVMRLIDMYGTNGTARPGLMTPEVEALCLEPIWIYVRKSSVYNKANHRETKTWHFHSTENHHAMDFTTHWHFAKLAKDRPEYRDLTLDDGTTLDKHYRDWNDYIIVYCRERAMKGTNIEIMCPGYNSVWLKGIYNFRDFGEPEVRLAAEMLIDLYWAYWAQEQINGVAGGGKTRIRGVKGFSDYLGHGIPALGWMYFGIGQKPSNFNGEYNALLSDYEPPAVVGEIAQSALMDGPYEIRQRAQGLGKQGVGSAIMGANSRPNQFRVNGGGIIRYSYCDPAFIIGTLMHEARPLKDWVAISSQSRWQGVIFRDSPGARIVPIVRPEGKARDVLNGHWSVQSQGSLITQKLEDSGKGGAMIVWISEEGLGDPIREEEWVFVESAGAYAAIRVVGSEFQLTDQQVSNPNLTGPPRSAPPGKVVVAEDDFAPIILEVMAKTEVESFEAFKEKAKACKMAMTGPVLRYKTIYGDMVAFDTSYRKTPAINGKRVDYAPANVHDSPYIKSVYGSGVVSITKGDTELQLDFNELIKSK